MNEKIGKVTLNLDYYEGQDFYSDGVIEEHLLELVKHHEPEEYQDIILKEKNWAVMYHLSQQRENILEWYPITKEDSVLEIGAGCGAISGVLAKKAGRVVANDLSKMRSSINAWKNKEAENLEIVVGNFNTVSDNLTETFDYVTLIGVFEYAKTYIQEEEPYRVFLDKINRHLKPNGKILMAIENKLGLKYFAGCKEDHVGRMFEGIEGYKNTSGVETFSKRELEKLLDANGYHNYRFYYPYPDYKFMTTLYSDRYLPKVGELSNNLRNFDRDRMLLFDEKKVFDMLIREGLFGQYSNSFLVMTGPMTDIVYSRFSNDRAEHLSIRTDILEKDGKHTVRKYPATSAAAAHIEALAENECVFTERFKDSTLSVNRLELKRNPDGLPFAEIEYLENSRTLEELLDECLQNNDEAGFDKLFDRYCKIAAWKAEGTKQDYDLTFPNICVQGDIWTMIDYEWTTDKLTPQQIISRALNCYGQEDPVRMEHPIVKKHLEALGIGKEQMRELSEKELAFQHFVLQEKDGRSRTALGQLRHLIGNRAVPYQEFFARADRKKVQVFEDFGAGYTPEHSYYQYDAYEADDLINARIICKAGTKAIRLDPAELPCLVQIHGIEWRGKALTRAQLDQCLSTNGQVLADTPSHVPTVLFETGDPNISVRLDCLDNEATDGEALIIRAQIAWLSAEMLQDIQARLAAAARRKGFWFQR